MTDHRQLPWPPEPIRTERLVLRPSEARDREVCIELNASPEVNAYLGGGRPRAELERQVPEIPGNRPGFFMVEHDGAAIGCLMLDARDPDRDPPLRRPELAGTDLGYLFLPSSWGRGFAAEACGAALGWFAAALPGEAVVLYTQTANTASMRLAAKLGFTEVERYFAWDADQWMGLWSPPPPA